MKEKTTPKFISFIKSIRVRIFIIVLFAVLLPTIFINLFFANVATESFISQKIERFRANNTRLKNNIITMGYIDNQDSEVVNTQIEQLAGEYNCRIEVINNQYQIVKDTDSSEEGKTSISGNVIKCLQGESIYDRNFEEQYVEFAIPLTASSMNANGKVRTNMIGALYINYSIADADAYRQQVNRYEIMIDLLMAVFAIAIAWICAYVVDKPIRTIEKTIEKIADGHMETVELKGSPEVLAINKDLNHMVEQINLQEKSRQEFVSNVSHELKTPITSMKVLADSILGQQGVPEELYQEFLQDISKEIDRENGVITDLLELVKMERSQSQLNISSVNINEIVETILKRLKPIAKTKNIELVFESFRPVIADVDEIKFASVITNLVENAIKYNNTDGTVTTSLNSDHQYFYIKVTDTGIGIAEEDQDRVFERFFRVDKARARETGGNGLGLAITKEIVLRHHGSIKIHSKEGEGTTFTVRIPLKYIQ